jgi:hypothetical protein
MRIADEQLDYLANSYIALEIGTLLRVTFEQYLLNTERCNEMAFALHQGHGINFNGVGSRIVTSH